MKKMPPIEKVYEAYSAIADHRITLQESSALVRSSNQKKEYQVTFKENTYTANDNASYWQGYPGYPVIAVLMLQGKLPYDEKVAAVFENVNWTELNKRYQRDYAKAAQEVMEASSLPQEQIREAAEQVYTALQELPLVMKRSALRPPK